MQQDAKKKNGQDDVIDKLKEKPKNNQSFKGANLLDKIQKDLM